MLAGFLFKTASLSWPQAFLILGVLVTASSLLVFLVRFSPADERTARQDMEARLQANMALAPASGD